MAEKPTLVARLWKRATSKEELTAAAAPDTPGSVRVRSRGRRRSGTTHISHLRRFWIFWTPHPPCLHSAIDLHYTIHATSVTLSALCGPTPPNPPRTSYVYYIPLIEPESSKQIVWKSHVNRCKWRFLLTSLHKQVVELHKLIMHSLNLGSHK